MHFDKPRRPTFFNVTKVYLYLNAVTKTHPAIRKEFEQVMAEGFSLLEYHKVDSGERAISSTTFNRWNVFLFECVGYEVERNRRRCPETCKALEQVPNMVQAFFSILDPGKSVPKHERPYLGYLRYYLGLRVPKNNPRKIVVNGQEYVWKEGVAVMFDDSRRHEVINNRMNCAWC